jgi:tetratricopeptide (TPR) repeat protein/serine/threonine protein kinase
MSEEEIFHQALARGPEDRAAYLEQACGGDPALRASVEALLRADVGATGFLERPAGAFRSPFAGEGPGLRGVTPTVDERPGGEGPGTAIGPYRLLEQIGEGGFGVVFLAEQAQPVRRRVALKVLKPGMDSGQVVARFEAERQALALMDHPNIAQIHDGGTTPDGRPFFVMELVKGVPITDYCDRCSLTTRERLGLFLSVCHAVQHAHQKGVIHRDIKPSNVLVAIQDGRPAAKVIDFGIAKAINQRLSEHTLATGFHQMVGTPLYMSPEQAEMSPLDVDTRADIYALGVLLYELLTGTTPLEKERLSKASYDELRRIIREEDAPAPSARLSTLQERLTAVAAQRRTDPRQLLRTVRGELDWIVMKALEKDRNRRYETANGFASDVQRFLADEPVQACPPSAWYRCRKFARRNKGALGVAGLVLVFLLLLGAGSGWVIGDRSARQAEAAQQVRESLTRARAWRGAGKVALARQELAEAKGRIGSDRAALDSLAEEIDALDAALARFQHFFDLVEQAHEAETRLTSELALSQTEGGKKPVAAPVSDPDRDSANAVPFRLQALSCYRVMERDDWSAVLGQALEQAALVQQVRRTVYEELLWLTSDVLQRAQDHRSGAKLSPAEAARHGLAYLHKAEQAWQPSLAYYRFRSRCRTAMGEKEAAGADQASARTTPATTAMDHYVLGVAAENARDRTEAIAHFEAALSLEPTHYWSLMRLGYCLTDLGQVREDFAAAVRVFTGCILKRPEHAYAYVCRGHAQRKLGQSGKALADYTKAIELRPDLAWAWNGRGNAHLDLHEHDKALADYSRAVELEPNLAMAWYNRGNLHLKRGQHEEAIADYSRAVKLKRNYPEAWNNRGNAYKSLGQYGKAIADYSRAVKLKPDLAVAWNNRGDAYRTLRQWARAIDDYAKASELAPADAWKLDELARLLATCPEVDRQSAQRGAAAIHKAVERSPDSVAAWTGLGWAHYRAGDWKASIEALEKSCALQKTPKGGGPAQWFFLAMAHWQLGDKDQAQTWYEKATTWIEKTGPRDQDFGGSQAEAAELMGIGGVARGRVYAERGQWDKAEASFAAAARTQPKNAAAFFAVGATYARFGRWDKAAAAYRRGLELDPSDQVCWGRVAILRLYIGDVEGYRQTCRAMAERFSATDNPQDAERTAKTSLLLPGTAADIEPALKLANRAVTGNEKHRFYWHFMLCQALADCRAGRHAAAVGWGKRLFPPAYRPGRAEGFAPYDATGCVILSLAQHGLGREEEARAALRQAQDIQARWLPNPEKGRPFGVNWAAWLQCLILCREAEALLPKETGNSKQGATEKAKAAPRK